MNSIKNLRSARNGGTCRIDWAAQGIFLRCLVAIGKRRIITTAGNLEAPVAIVCGNVLDELLFMLKGYER